MISCGPFVLHAWQTVAFGCSISAIWMSAMSGMEVMAIKDSIAHVNQLKWHPQPRLSSCQDDWLPMVHAFSQKWGADHVPKDIKGSREEVEAGLQAADRARKTI